MSTYIWSDCHLGHTNILVYEKRPFADVNYMNDFILSNWKKTIKKHDVIFNLGDFIFHPKKEIVEQIVRSCPGYKILILGNHDRDKSVKWWLDVGFNEVYKYPIIFQEFWILSHEPQYVNPSMPYVNIHGHLHSQEYKDKQHVNVSVELTGFKPILFEDIKNKFKE